MARGTSGRSVLHRLRYLLVAVSLVCAALAAVFGPALTAAAAGPPPAPSQPSGARLATLLQRERNILSYERLSLTLANSVVEALRDFIADQKGQGKNTSTLEDGLASFQAATTSARSLYDAAKSTLDAKAGFSADGTVADFTQARETVRTAGKAERDFHRTMREARTKLWQAFKNYRTANKV